jgi:TolA-binding protein
VPEDGREDTTLFLRGLRAYRTQDWSKAISHLENFITAHPKARHTERAYFLLAKSYDELHSDAQSAQFEKTKRHYEDAVNRFPDSIYAPDALLAIGNLCLETKNYNEALGYFNLILKRHQDSAAAMRALMQKVKILVVKKRTNDARSILKHVIREYPGTSEETEAKLQLAKILHDTHSFRKSLDLLSELQRTNPENIELYPEIFLYLGYNHDQLGDRISARENLLRFYNSCPDRETNHLILTKIADTYIDEGATEDAVKFYQLVLERYPGTEGAVISEIRLAEQQEQGNLVIKRGIASPTNIIGRVIRFPKEIYEDIVNNLLDKDEESPLAEFALLKLAILYQKDRDYEKSLMALKELLKKYPWTSLREESKHTLRSTLDAILREEMKRKRYVNIINTYQREKELFFIINAPGPFLTVARASVQLKLLDTATEMYEKVDTLLAEEEKPPDLLFFISRDLIEESAPEAALARLNLLTHAYPNDDHAPLAYELKGKILYEQKKFQEAAAMFSSALNYRLRRCKRTRILTDKARALMEAKLTEKALEATKEADKSKALCDGSDPHLYQDIGELYFYLGLPEPALAVFNRALEIEKDDEKKFYLNLKIARCFKALSKNEDYLALYNQISNLDDPFWSNLAEERINEITFESEIMQRHNE